MVRNWTDGETLTAGAMNELVSSTTMRFPSAASRDATLVGDLAPVEGMTVFLLDSNLTFKYIVVGGAGYWAPQAGTLCFSAYQKASQALGATVANYIAPMDGLIGNRNINNWYNPATGTFKPLCPGFYQLFGGVGIAAVNFIGVTYAAFSGSDGQAILSSMRYFQHGTYTTGSVAFNARRHTVYMNGTTDFSRLVEYSGVALNTAIALGDSVNASFGAIYLGM